MNEYEGHWITTYTGKKFHYLDPRPEEIDIVDIAHALSLTCRFGGHCREFYSVADHSIRVAEIVPKEYKLQALLHDSAEAYLPDIPSPIKYDLPSYKSIETRINAVVVNKFGLSSPMVNGDIKMADDILLATEARDLMSNTDGWAELPEPLSSIIKPMGWGEARALFLHCFNKYSKELP